MPLPNGAQNELQQPLQPLQTTPSMTQEVVRVAQMPAVVAVAPTHTPVQQSLSCRQMSPGWVQYETCIGEAQVPPAHFLEQHSPSFAHMLPAVLHEVLSGLQVPPTHWVEQQVVPPGVQGWLSEMHCVPQVLFDWQLRPQQSVETLHGALSGWHMPTTQLTPSHTPEQHWLETVQLRPVAVQPPSVDGITTPERSALASPPPSRPASPPVAPVESQLQPCIEPSPSVTTRTASSLRIRLLLASSYRIVETQEQPDCPEHAAVPPGARQFSPAQQSVATLHPWP
jgi:hypothetical protein